MNVFYAICVLSLSIIGLIFWLAQKYKDEGVSEVVTKELQGDLDAKTDEARRLADPARDRRSVFDSLRRKAKQQLSDSDYPSECVINWADKPETPSCVIDYFDKTDRQLP